MAYEKKARTPPFSSSALRVAGQELQSDKKYPEAISIFEYMLEKRPDDAFAYITLGRAYEENGQLVLAKEIYEQGYQTAVVTAHPQVYEHVALIEGKNEEFSSSAHLHKNPILDMPSKSRWGGMFNVTCPTK